ncbi:MAG: ATP-binding protein [Candidatus Enteromonas sp.]
MSKKEKVLTRAQKIERSLDTEFKFSIWHRFIEALGAYKLVNDGDKVCVCISGGKDSMLLALLFKHLKRYSKTDFEVKYLIMNPGYNDENFEMIKKNVEAMEIPAVIVNTDIFAIANNTTEKPCYLCAKMRRGALYRIAKDMGCNKIALGHHYDDVIETTLMNMLNSGSFQTMLPKLHSTHFAGMEIIRPLYLTREEDIIAFAAYNDLHFIRCACRFTESYKNSESGHEGSQRAATKALIKELKNNYSPLVEKNIFKAGTNVTLDKVLGYKNEGVYHDYLDTYEEEGEKINEMIKNLKIEEAVIEKAEKEHQELIIDKTYFKKYGNN